MSEQMTGQIVAVSFEDGTDRGPYCGLDECPCPEHEVEAAAAGTYVTIRLDQDHRVGFWRVHITPEEK